MKRLQVDLKDSVSEEFTRHADREGRNKSDIVRVLILEWNRSRRVELAREQRRKEEESRDE